MYVVYLPFTKSLHHGNFINEIFVDNNLVFNMMTTP